MTSPVHSDSQTPSRGSLAELLRSREAGAWPYAFHLPRDHGDPSTGLAGAAEVALEMCGGPTDAKFLWQGKAGFPGEVRRAIAQARGRCIPRCIARSAGLGRSLSRPRRRGGGRVGEEGQKTDREFVL